MTIGDYIRKKLSTWSVEYPAELISLELSRIGLSDLDDVTGETNLDQFFYNIIPDLLSTPKSVSEGGYSISYNVAGISAFYKMVASRLGKPDMISGNTIKDITNRW